MQRRTNISAVSATGIGHLHREIAHDGRSLLQRRLHIEVEDVEQLERSFLVQQGLSGLRLRQGLCRRHD